jgi:hypothetical protein
MDPYLMTYLGVGVLFLFGAVMVVNKIRLEQNNPPITLENGQIEIIGFVKNRIIKSSEIAKITMDMVTVPEYEGPDEDYITFKFELKNGKTLVLKGNLNTQSFLPSIKNIFRNKLVPSLAIYQIKDILKRNPDIELDKFTKSYLETGNADLFIESRRI